MNRISFPKEEHKDIRKRLKETCFIYTTRVDKEVGVYRQGKTYRAPWGDDLKVESVKSYQRISNHPFYKVLTYTQRQNIKKYSEDVNKRYEVIKLSLVGATDLQTRPGEMILKELKGVRYGAYNKKLEKSMFGDEFFEYIDQGNTSEFVVLSPARVLTLKVGTCYDTANFIYHRLKQMKREATYLNIDRIHIIFYEYPMKGNKDETQTHTAVIYRIKKDYINDTEDKKWIHVEYSDNPHRGVHVLRNINGVFQEKPSYINWDAPSISQQTLMDKYYQMCRYPKGGNR